MRQGGLSYLKLPEVTNINFLLTISINNREKVMRINKMITCYFCIKEFLRKCIEIGLENLYVDIWGLEL